MCEPSTYTSYVRWFERRFLFSENSVTKYKCVIGIDVAWTYLLVLSLVGTRFAYSNRDNCGHCISFLLERDVAQR